MPLRVLALTSLFVFACSPPTPTTAADAAMTTSDAAAADAAMTTSDAAAGDATTTDTWTGWGRGFFATYCVECHGAGNAKRDYTTYADVQRDAATIACGVAATALPGCGPFPPPRQFPINDASGTNPKPPDDVRARLVSWIQAGAPE